MTCPTCNGTMMLPNPNGIGVVVCTDCKDGKIKRSNMKESTKPEASLFDARVALLVALIAFVTCFFVAGEVRAQTVYPAITSEAAKYNNGDIVASPTGFWIMDADTVGIGAIKKDTILVAIACKRRVSETFANHASGSAFHVSTFDALEVKVLHQERTLEWQSVWLSSPSKNGLSTGMYAVEQKWVATKTRWLDPIEGCYQLTPLTNK